MKRKNTRKLIVLLLASLLCLSLVACGSSSKSAAGDSASSAETNSSVPASGGVSQDYAMPEPEEETGVDDTTQLNAKLIYEADAGIETTDFDASLASLKERLAQAGGYLEESNISYGRNELRSGYYTLRVPTENYQSMMAAVETIGKVLYCNENVRDVTLQYADTEAHLATQRIKQERLMALMEQADSIDDLITLEAALADVEYEIEILASTLKNYDNLVGYSTIHVSLDEVVRVSDTIAEKQTLISKMGTGLQSSWHDLVDGLENFVIWLSYNLFALLLIAAVIVGVIFVCRWLRKRRRGDAHETRRERKRREKAERETASDAYEMKENTSEKK